MKDNAGASGAAVGDAVVGDNAGGRKILDWGEDGKPIYEDGSVGDGEEVADNGQRELQAKVCALPWGPSVLLT